MLGKMMGKGGQAAGKEGAAVAAKAYDILEGTQVDTTDLPVAPRSAFRKRPQKIAYDKNEYYMFRLPSEDAKLMAPFDKDAIFGKRDGINYSPHIKTQIDIDTKLVWLIGGMSVFALFAMGRDNNEFSALRMNYRYSNWGRFSADDFVEKKH